MNAIELFHADGKPANVFYCEKCRSVHADKHLASDCCGPRKCRRCESQGEFTGGFCPPCRSAVRQENNERRLHAAEKINLSKSSISSYSGWDGWIFSEGHGDEFFPSVAEFLEWCEDSEVDPPPYVWATDPVRFACVTLSDILDRLYDEAYEGFEADCLSGVDELQTALDAFNKANEELVSYSVDFKKALVLDTDDIYSDWDAIDDDSKGGPL